MHGNLSTNQVKLLVAVPGCSRPKFRLNYRLQRWSNQHNDYELKPLKMGFSRTTLFSVDGSIIKFKATSVDGRTIICKAASGTLKKTSSWPIQDIAYTLFAFLAFPTLGCVVAPPIIPHVAFVWKGALVSLLLSFLLWLKTRLVGEAQRSFCLTPEKLVAPDRALTLGIWFLAILDFAEFSNISLQYVSTMFGIGALISTIAAKDIISDVFHGMIMVLSNVFKKGDTITLKKGADKTTGKVDIMGVIYTKLVKGGSTITLHNSVFSEGAILKKEAAECRPRLTTITIESDDLDKIYTISHDILEMLGKQDDLRSGKPPYCSLISFKHPSAELLIVFEVKVESQEELFARNQLLIREYADIAKRHGAKLTGVERIQSSEDSSMIETC